MSMRCDTIEQGLATFLGKEAEPLLMMLSCLGSTSSDHLTVILEVVVQRLV